MKKALGMIGIGLVVGAVVYVLLNRTDKTKNDSVMKTEEDSFTVTPNNAVSTVKPNESHNARGEFENVKSLSIDNMSIRHGEASKIMKDAVEIICKRSEISEDENRDLEQISAGLDELLSEE